MTALKYGSVLIVGFLLGFFVGFSNSEDGEFLLKYRQAQKDFGQLNQRFLRLRIENGDLIGQVRTLEKAIEAQKRELGKTKADVD